MGISILLPFDYPHRSPCLRRPKTSGISFRRRMDVGKATWEIPNFSGISSSRIPSRGLTYQPRTPSGDFTFSLNFRSTTRGCISRSIRRSRTCHIKYSRRYRALLLYAVDSSVASSTRSLSWIVIDSPYNILTSGRLI